MNQRYLERIKSTILVFLVLLSFVLTGYLWYSAPSYEENRDDDYIQPPYIGSEKDNDISTYDLTQPQQIIAHRTGQHLLIHSNEKVFQELYNMVRGVSLVDFTVVQPTPEDWNRYYNQSQASELQFPNGCTVGQLDTFFQRTTLRDESTLQALSQINRLGFFTDSKSNRVWMWFFSDDAQQVVQARVDNLTPTQLQTALNQVMPNRNPLVIPVPTNEKAPWDPMNKNIPFSHMLYLPTAPLRVNSFAYDFRTIDINTMKQWLFKDPYVTPIQLNNDELLYMYNSQDQNIYSDQIINYRKKQGMMTYTNSPTPTEKPRMLIREELNLINQFMQLHRGWTGSYVLDQLTSDKQVNTYLFRMLLRGFPVYWENEQPGNQPNTIELSVTQNSVSKYSRSLILLTGSTPEQKPNLLPAHDQLLDQLKKKKVSLASISSIYPALMGAQRNEQHILLQPVWVVKYTDGKIETISAEKEER
ncbi:Two-component signal transduction system YycFG, regulatory protein YycH [Seinonella peptonophila]|uniref:Two-component signal transduction system YycFG, regulatory protein YycH n=1 Tax=Seinonella peptonophila TaxID=112248 RepID=A0A1M4WX34_9BACL|nr:two-component system activity regulator YycH [Seinonella peptonophila]SHE85758.1 Two-component signal transduction system YycFG, regulatory protein YycH [Seinonella peptonophila]